MHFVKFERHYCNVLQITSIQMYKIENRKNDYRIVFHFDNGNYQNWDLPDIPDLEHANLLLETAVIRLADWPFKSNVITIDELAGK